MQVRLIYVMNYKIIFFVETIIRIILLSVMKRRYRISTYSGMPNNENFASAELNKLDTHEDNIIIKFSVKKWAFAL